MKTITIDNIDLDLLVQQKSSLLLLMEHPGLPEDWLEDLDGILNLLDEIQDQLEDND